MTTKSRHRCPNCRQYARFKRGNVKQCGSCLKAKKKRNTDKKKNVNKE